MSEAAEKPFGLRLYEELRELGGLEPITATLNYADIQRLKAARREDLVEILRGSSDELMRHLAQDPPERFAARMIRSFEQRRAGNAMLVLFGLSALG